MTVLEEYKNLPYRPCVGIMVCNQNGEVFAGMRLDSPQNAWQMPQGGIELGEEPKEAALRELEEETGILRDKVKLITQTKDWVHYDLPNHLIGRFWNGQYRGQKQIWFLLQFQGEDADININTKEPEFSKWQWLQATELLKKIVPFKKDIYRTVIAEFKRNIDEMAL